MKRGQKNPGAAIANALRPRVRAARRRPALGCPCGVTTRTLRQLVEHQTAAHGIGERQPVADIFDDVSWYDEDANKRADL